MSVKSTEMQNGQPAADLNAAPKGRGDWSLSLGKVGLFLVVLAFGLPIWAINGGFSVIGLEVVAGLFNDAGLLMWRAIALWTFTLPGSPDASLPVLPWFGVVAATVLQIVVLYRTLSRKTVPAWLGITAAVLSLYDYGTTFAGLGTVAWLKDAGFVVQGLLALLITFVVEIVVTFAIRLLKR